MRRDVISEQVAYGTYFSEFKILLIHQKCKIAHCAAHLKSIFSLKPEIEMLQEFTRCTIVLLLESLECIANYSFIEIQF